MTSEQPYGQWLEERRRRGHTPEEFSNLDKAMERIDALAQELKVKLQRCVVIDVLGMADSGKSVLIERFMGRHPDLKSGYPHWVPEATATKDVDKREEWERAMRSDYVLLHTPGTDSSAVYAVQWGYPVDLLVYIYHPRRDKVVPESVREIADLIVRNWKARRKLKK